LGSTAVVLAEKRASMRWLEHDGLVRVGQAVLRVLDQPARELDGALREGPA
jgi:hypothetical protein